MTTSFEAYKKIMDSGDLGRLQKTVYSYICANPGKTARHCEDFFSRPGLARRYSELEKMGLIRPGGVMLYRGHNRNTYNSILSAEINAEYKSVKIDYKAIVAKVKKTLEDMPINTNKYTAQRSAINSIIEILKSGGVYGF